MNPGRLLLIVPLVLASLGVESLYVYLTNPKPRDISITELINAAPREKWLRVEGGRISVAEAVLIESKLTKQIEELYIPIRPVDDLDDSDTKVLLRTDDPKLRDLARRIDDFEESGGSDAKAIEFVVANRHLLLQERTFEGLLQFGLDDDDERNFQVSKRFPSMDRNPVIIRENKRPSLGNGIGILVVSLIFGLILWLRFPSRKNNTTLPPPLPSSVPPPLPDPSLKG